MTIERNTDTAGMGNFSRVQKIHWHPVNRDMWVVPAMQQGLISASRGGMVALAGLLIVGLMWSGLNLWEVAGIAAAAGAIVALADFTGNIAERFTAFHNAEVSNETYERESSGSAARVEERVVVEVREPTDTGYGRTLYDQLQCSQSDLARLAQVESLSVRALQDEGFSFEFSKRILGELLKNGFIQYAAANRPAEWTGKGKALVHHYQRGEVVNVA